MATTQGIKLSDQLQARLKELGRLKQRSPHWLMRTAIEQFLEQEERYEREKREDMERWQKYQLTGHAVSHDEAAEWLGDLAEGKATPCPEVTWLADSLADIERLYPFLQPHNPAAASHAAGIILSGSEQLLKSRELGRPTGDGTSRRELSLPFGIGVYMLRYMFEHPDKAVIIRVGHDRKDRISTPSPAKE